jgi:DNA ligase (NAD+)
VCPECGSNLIRQEGEAVHYCPNDEGCPPQIVGKIQHFISRRAMNIEGLGSETIETFYRQGYLSHISDIYLLHEKSDHLKALDRFGERSITNMLEGIERSKQMPFEKVLFGLGIRYVGETVARKIALHFKNIESLMSASLEELTSVEEIGGRIAESLLTYFQEPRHLEQIEKLRQAGLQFHAEETIIELQSNKLEGKTFVISGVFENYSRDELKDLIESHGGKILSGISSKLSYLVAGDNMGPSKLEKAKKLNIPLISDAALLEMIV